MKSKFSSQEQKLVFPTIFFVKSTRNVALAVSVCAGIFVFAIQSVVACGLGWKLPKNHFNGVDARGHISYWERIGEVDFGDDFKIPLQISFNSGRDAGVPSPYLGQGWLLPLLESKFVQDDERHFHMVQPDGINNRFVRSNPEEKVLNGSAGWKGEIKDDTITVWASCGWKIIFNKGRIASMTNPKGRQLNWVYENGRVTELRDANSARLKIGYNIAGQVESLILSNQAKILVNLAKKPRVQTIGGQRAVVGVDDSLSKLVLVDGQERNYDFKVDVELFPTLSIGHEAGRIYRWDPMTKAILSDGRWDYVTTGNQTHTNTTIARKNKTGLYESWNQDADNAREVTISSTGEKRTRTWFQAGVLAGHTRSETIERDGKEVSVKKWSYDELGRVIRIVGSGNFVTVYSRNKAGLLENVTTEKNGTVTALQLFDTQGRLIQNGRDASKARLYTYKLPDGSWSRQISGVIDKARQFVGGIDKDVATIETVPSRRGKSYVLLDEARKKIAYVDPLGNVEQSFPVGRGNGTLINGKTGSTWSYLPDGRRKEQRYFAADGITLVKRIVYQYPDLNTIRIITQYPAKQKQTETDLHFTDAGIAAGQSVKTSDELNPPL